MDWIFTDAKVAKNAVCEREKEGLIEHNWRGGVKELRVREEGKKEKKKDKSAINK